METYFEGHSLLQALINHCKIQDPGPLILLFCNGILQPDNKTIKTLSILCQNCVLPEVICNGNSVKSDFSCIDNVRINLLDWFLKGNEKYLSKDLAKVLFALIVKRFEEDIIKSVDEKDTLITSVNIYEFCKLIANNYLTCAFINMNFKMLPNNMEVNTKARVDNIAKKKLYNLLDVRWERLNEDLHKNSFNNQVQVLEDCFWFCELLGYLISHLRIADISETSASCTVDNFLVKKLEKILYEATTKTFDLIKIKFVNLSFFSSFYSADFSSDVKRMIRQPNFLNMNLLQYLFELFTLRNKKDLGKNKKSIFLYFT